MSEQVFEINGKLLLQSEINEIVSKIIDIFQDKKITHAMAYMILEGVKNQLQNTIVKKGN